MKLFNLLPPPPPARLRSLAAAMACLLLLAGTVQAQTVGQAACPSGVTQKSPNLLRVSNVQADRATLEGGLVISDSDISSLSDVTVNRLSGWFSATLYFGVRGYGYPDGAHDARRYKDQDNMMQPVEFQDGDLVHGAWFHAGRVGVNDLTPSPHTVLSLEPSTTYVAQIVVGELRNSQGQIVTNQYVSGTTTPTMPNKPKPVLAQVCFQTAASGS